MRRGLTLIEFLACLAVVAIIVAMFLPVIMRQPPTPLVPPAQVSTEAVDFQNSAGQSFAYIGGDELAPWLSEHKDCEVVCLAPVCKNLGTANPTTHFVIVYRRLAQK
jgi:prepilin-type N-terminal cleavage/methylation domain-containing protein